MNDQKLDIIIQLLRQGNGAEEAANQLDKVQKTAKAADSSVAGLRAGWLAVGGAMAAVAVTLVASVREFAESEKVVAKLNASLRSTGTFSEENSKKLRAMAGDLAIATNNSKGAVTDMMAQLIAFGAPQKGLERISKAVLDLSALMGNDLSSATHAVARAMQGEFQAFERLGIRIDTTKDSGHQWLELLGKIEALAGGQAAAQADTLAGKFDRLSNSMKGASKSLGEMLAPLASGVLDVINDVAAAANGSTEKQFAAMNREIAAQKELNKELFVKIDLMEKAGRISSKRADELKSSLVAPVAHYEGADLQIGEFPFAFANRLSKLVNERRAAGKAVNDEVNGGSANAQPIPATILAKMAAEKDKANAAKLDSIWEDEIQRMEEVKKAREQLGEEIGRMAEDEAQRLDDLAAQQEKINDDALAGQVRYFQAVNELKQESSLIGLHGIKLEQRQLEISQERRIAALNQMQNLSEDEYAALADNVGRLNALEQAQFAKTHSFLGGLKADIRDLGQRVEQDFAGGMAHGIVEIAKGAKSAGEAMQEFFSHFFEMIGEAILQMLIFRAIQAGTRAFGFAGGGTATAMAAGGMIMAASGIQTVDSPTYFPKFNVLAGEAGREVMTVMARPRLESIGGILAQVGSVQGLGMAIMPLDGARKLAEGGGAGSVDGGGSSDNALRVEVALSPGLEARITDNAVTRARISVLKDTQRDTPLANSIRRLST